MQVVIDPPLSAPRAISAFEIESIIDSPLQQTVTARVAIVGLDNPVDFVLWNRSNYSTAGARGDGQWTDTDAQNRVLELIEARFGS